MSTFLQLAVKGQREADIVGTEIAAVTGQSGELKRLVNWIIDAWTEIQNRHTNWRWMRSTFTVNTTSGDDQYAGTDCTDSRLSAAVSRFARWILFDDSGKSNVKIYLSSAGVGTEHWMSFMPWSVFQTVYKIGTQNNSYPAHYTVDPQNNLRLGPKPDGTYVVSGEYQMSAQTLAANSDEPEMPARFHDLIVWDALLKYGSFEESSGVVARANSYATKLMRQLEADQWPGFVRGAPLA